MAASIIVVYLICGYGFSVLVDTIFELQRGPEFPLWAWFLVALAWPPLLLLAGLYAALHTAFTK